MAEQNSFSIYVKKRNYLFHILNDDNLTFLSLSTNTLQQKPLEEIFDLLLTLKTAFSLEDIECFKDTLTTFHHSYQLRTESKVSMLMNKMMDSYMSSSMNSDLEDDQHTNSEFDDTNYTDLNSDGFYSPSPRNISSKDTDINNLCSPTTLNLPSPTPSKYNLLHLQSPTNSKNSKKMMIYLQSPTNSPRTHTNLHSKRNSKSHSMPSHSNKTPLTKSSITYNYDHAQYHQKEKKIEQKEKEEFEENMDHFVLKKGWMTKLGETFKTWKYRYFELWSNGLLNYFDNEMKLKKKGSINIVDEVIAIDLYSKENKKKSEK